MLKKIDIIFVLLSNENMADYVEIKSFPNLMP